MTLSKHQPRGIALMIVLVTVAVSTVLAFALIGSQATLAQASSNGVRAMQADAMAESGLQLAAYYLQNPSEAPVLNASGYYPGQTGISLGADAEGTVDIVVTQVAGGTFDIACTANSGRSSTLQRTVGARANVTYGYLPAESTQVNGPMAVSGNTIINGSIRANGQVSVAVGGRVNGTVYGTSIIGSLLNVLHTITTQVVNGATNPVSTTVKNYKTYTYNGQTYSAKQLQLTASTNVLGPTSDNPLGVYYTAAGANIDKNLTLNGTLIADGTVTIKTSAVTITAQSGMPALVANNDVVFNGSTRTLTVTGLSWIKGSITKSGLLGSNQNAKFNGAVQFAGTTPVNSLYTGNIEINYEPEKAIVPGFVAGADNTAYSVKLTSFSSSTASTN